MFQFAGFNMTFIPIASIFQKFRSNARTNLMNGTIRVKEENATATNEMSVQVHKEISQSKIKHEINDSVNEERLTAELSSARKKYSDAYFQLQKEKEIVNCLNLEKCALVEQIKDMNKKMTTIELEKKNILDQLAYVRAKLSSLEKDKKNFCEAIEGGRQKYTVLITENSKLLEKFKDIGVKLDSVKKENNILKARTKQLQFGVHQNIDYNRERKEYNEKKHESSDEDVFEVQEILQHKMMKKKRHFLVRWKGYDSSDDSWVPETRLNCQKILKSYLKFKKIE